MAYCLTVQHALHILYLQHPNVLLPKKHHHTPPQQYTLGADTKRNIGIAEEFPIFQKNVKSPLHPPSLYRSTSCPPCTLTINSHSRKVALEQKTSSMQLNNLSQTSLSSRDKDLPPVPPLDTARPAAFLLASPTSPADVLALEMARFQKLKAQQQKKKTRPAPLLNLDKAKQPQLNFVESLKTLDILDEPQTRKRQTVISSISPTKLVYTPSPRDQKLPIWGSASPVATTYGSLGYDLRDEKFVHLKDLGLGNLGVVLKVLHVPLQKTMARKIIHIESKQDVQTQIIRELRIMHEVRSPFIIEFYGAFLRPNNSIVLCMEYCNCGALDKILLLCDNGQFPVPALKKALYSILSGLTYLYNTHKIIHRDIKPSNVLMTHKGEFKLCDFGVSRELTNSILMADTFVGTSTYMSPERIQGLTYGVKSDIWSMGLMLYELATGKSIWVDDDADQSKPAGPEGILDLLQRIVNEDPPCLSNKTNKLTGAPYEPDLCEFIESCLVKDDAKRKSPQELLANEQGFLKGVPEGVYDKDVKAWAKTIRKRNKEKNEAS